jgi:hypothetical protein
LNKLPVRRWSGGRYTKEGREYGNCTFVSVSSMPFVTFIGMKSARDKKKGAEL